jgi:hypothetical protein
MASFVYRRVLMSRCYKTYKERKENKVPVVSVILVGLQEQVCV